MALWCRDLPVVTVGRSIVPRALTLVVPYYEQPLFCAKQLAHWAALPVTLRRHLTVILVDDGSPTKPLYRVEVPPGLTLRRFRIDVDIRWNWLAARNIGMHHAAPGWCLLTDMDHQVPVETFDAIIHGLHDPRIVYAFHRREHTGAAATPHSASFLLTRDLFWQVGGYDERGSGYYGNDGPFRRRLAATARLQLLPEMLERHEYVDDASVTTYQRKQPIDAELKTKLRQPGPPKVLSFPYHELTPCSVS